LEKVPEVVLSLQKVADFFAFSCGFLAKIIIFVPTL